MIERHNQRFAAGSDYSIEPDFFSTVTHEGLPFAALADNILVDVEKNPQPQTPLAATASVISRLQK